MLIWEAWSRLHHAYEQADPILTPIITALLSQAIGSAAVGFTIAGTGITIGAAVTALVTVAIGIGLALLFAPHPTLPPPEDGTIAVQQSLPYRMFVYGRGRVAGAIMLKEATGPYLLYVAALAGHRIDGVEAVYLNDDEVNLTLQSIAAGSFVVGLTYQIVSVGSTSFTAIGATSNAVGVVFTATGVGSGSGTANPTNTMYGFVNGGADGRYGGAILVDQRLGLPTERNYDFITTLLPSYWDATHRGDGQASLGMKCTGVGAQSFITVYPYGAPMPSAILRGYQLYDPRDATQNINDASTWKFSQNAALAILHFICFSEFGFKSPYATAIEPFLDQWVQSANDCDEQVLLKSGGTEPRYTLGGWTTTQQARTTSLLTMLQCCDGFLARRGAGYWLQIGKYYAPTVYLTDDDIVGFIIQTDVSSEDKVNEATAYWSDPDNGYVSVDTDPIINEADQIARGGAPRKAQLQLPWVHSVGQASRLLVREMFRQGVPIRGTLTLGWSGLNAAYERWIGINSNSIPRLTGVVIENRKAVISASTRTLTLDFILSGPALDAYDPVTQESSVPPVPQRPTTVGLPIPANVSVVPELTTDASGASTVVLAVSWDAPLFNGVLWNLNYALRYRQTLVGSEPGDWAPNQSFESPTIADGRVSIQSAVVPSGQSLDVQIASVSTGATLSTWSTIVTVSTVLANVAPAPPAWISATPVSGGANLSVKAPPSVNFVKVQFYRGLSGDPFSAATAIGSPVTGSPNATIVYSDTVGPGSYDYFAVSLTSASIASAPTPPEPATVT